MLHKFKDIPAAFLLQVMLFCMLPAAGIAGDGGDAKLERLMALTVYKTPTCGCCGKWVEHIEDAGFAVKVREMNDLSAIKRSSGIAPTHQSCHTAVAEDGGYVFEGHVPAQYIEAFLADPPEGARGLVVPAMPVGSPGMEYGDQFAPYDVLLLNSDGSYAVYARVTGPQGAGQH